MNEQYDYFRAYLESFLPDPLIDGLYEDDDKGHATNE